MASLPILSATEQETLTKDKVVLARDNELYMRDHPEINTLISGLVKEMLEKRPKEPIAFAVQYVTQLAPVTAAVALSAPGPSRK